MRKSSPYKQGIYKPVHTEKYAGNDCPVYRSGWELKFFRWCDNNPNVLKWGSETVIIPYISSISGKTHRYFVDCFVLYKSASGTEKLLIEIKPKCKTVRPVISKRKHKKTVLYENLEYIQNQDKWAAARKWCDKKGFKFVILTEEELNLNK